MTKCPLSWLWGPSYVDVYFWNHQYSRMRTDYCDDEG